MSPLDGVQSSGPDLALNQVLDYYDGPILIWASDEYGKEFILCAIRPDGNWDYAGYRVLGMPLARFFEGKIDLLELIQNRPESKYLMARFSQDVANQLITAERPGPVPDDYLPGAGYFYKNKILGRVEDKGGTEQADEDQNSL